MRCILPVVVACCATAPAAAQPAGLERYRITVGPVVELPGVIRLDGKQITGSVVASDKDSATIARDGARVAVVRPRRSIVGVLSNNGYQTLALTRDREPAVTIPRAAIVRVERSSGAPSRGRSALRGLLIGAAAGVVIGVSGPGSQCGFPCNRAAFGAVSGAFLGGIGAAIGAMLPHESFHDAPLPAPVNRP
jgi:hypothetical protein